ncbi:hypothetical protein V4890_23695 [Ralstonia solanacearum species complex bacterium KE056]|uniref:hypothetical protein n=1 Tax=Ralstonia solanacearum species complex bacterium KE056 TaxID=3119585 RepID=UPI002FC35676
MDRTNSKVISIFLAILFLTAFGCARIKFEPQGKYFLEENNVAYTLDIMVGGHYKMTVMRSPGQSENFSGVWEWEREGDGVLTISGIQWRGMTMEHGAGFWRIQLEGNRGQRICLDAEGITCFVKK